MTTTSNIPARGANTRKEQTHETLRVSRKDLRSNAAVLRKVEALYPIKTAIYLHQLTGEPVRTCEYWLQKRRLPSEAVWALLQSDSGMDFLIAGMTDARPKWFTWLLRLGVAGSVMRRRAADRRLLETTLDADRDLAETIARTAAFSDEEFHRPFLDALGSVAGSQGRPVDAPAGKGTRR